MKGMRGFTLVELMVVLAIAGVLLALSVPFGRYINNTAATSYLHEFTTTLSLARSSAITSGAQVVICRLTDVVDNDGNPTGDKDCLKTNNGCLSDSADAVEWQGGWAVFIDKNDDCSITNGDNADTTDNDGNGIPDSKENDDTIVHIYQALPPGYTLTGGKTELIVFNSVGQVTTFGNTWTLCPPGGNVSLSKAIVLSSTGKARFEEPGESCTGSS